VLAVLAIIIVGKSIAAAALVLVFRYPLNTALNVSASLGQIGEFSFILAGLGASLGLLRPEGQSLILAGALLSIAVNPLVFKGADWLEQWLESHPALAAKFARSTDPLSELPMATDEKYLSRQVVLVGYGRVGKRLAAELHAQDIPFVVVEQNRERVEQLRASGITAVSGDAADAGVLIQAHIARASMLVIAAPDAFNVRQMVAHARMLNPHIETVVRTHNAAEAALLAQENMGRVFLGEDELAHNMGRHVLERFGKAA
ncbi:MAG: NAD-binding protein, partial [Rhodoferax sp.]|uniref:NAD-binding protein n=1 Tax=Rhodoferax sp. TaxID=50421 RepID=UPI0032652886